MFTFFLGIHHPHWLAHTRVPVFVSRRALAARKAPITAAGPWALDSGGFTELSKFGRWTISPAEYVAEVRRWIEEIGGLQWAAAQDWMCEPVIIEGGTLPNGVKAPGTGLSVREHQTRTVENFLDLQRLGPGLPWVPVLQGWEFEDYLRHAEDYQEAGVDLASMPVVGLGSVCRRQNTSMAEELIRTLAGMGIKLHGFGFKTASLPNVARWLVSSDSMAWSFTARRERIRLPGCQHKTCTNCLRYALVWRDEVIKSAERCFVRPIQQSLFGAIA